MKPRSKGRARKAQAPIDVVKRYLEQLGKKASKQRKRVLKSARVAMERLYGR